MQKALLFLSFLLFNSFLSFAVEKPDPVLDSDGEEVRAGVEYYILDSSRGGGVTTHGRSTGDESCPLAVVLTGVDFFRGHPVTFTPANPEEGVVHVSTDLNIKFSEAIPVCNESDVWKVDFDEQLGRHFIANNGVEGNPGCGTLHNWFKIEKAIVPRQFYTLVFCPSVCDLGYPICEPVRIIVNRDGIWRLYLGTAGARGYSVSFVKARSMKNEDILNSVSSA